MLLMPPRHGKSRIASQSFPAWHLGRCPDHEIIAASYNISLSMNFSRKAKALIDDPKYAQVFPGIMLDPNNQSAENWGLLGHMNGGYVAAGVGGGITGKGAHILIIDDPVKNAEEADSQITREAIKEWYGSTAYTRLAPGGGVLVIQTCWHDDDLAGYLQRTMANDPDADQFEIIKYPAVAEADEWLDLTADDIVRIETDEKESDVLQATARALKHGYDIKNLKYLRSKGQALHPQRYDLAKLNRSRKAMSSRFWNALYQQNPVPEDGDYFVKSYFKRAALPQPRFCNIYMAWDFAISEKQTNDYTVGVVGLQDPDDMLTIADVVRFKSGDAFFIVEAIINMVKRWHIKGQMLSFRAGFEDGQIFRAIQMLLKKRMQEEKMYFSYDVLKPITDKMARARPLQGRMQQGMIAYNKDAEWYSVVQTEMLRFPAGLNDDTVDAQAWLAQMVVGVQPPKRPVAKEHKSWKDKLNVGRGRGAGHMVA